VREQLVREVAQVTSRAPSSTKPAQAGLLEKLGVGLRRLFGS
jgi:hypothetical protein